MSQYKTQKEMTKHRKERENDPKTTWGASKQDVKDALPVDLSSRS